MRTTLPPRTCGDCLTNVYESPALLRQYLDFHFRSSEPEYLPLHPVDDELLDYPARCAEVVLEYAENRGRALDLGCAVGGSSFALATGFDEVIGIDFSHAFVDTAAEMAETGSFRLSEEAYVPPSDVRKCTPRFQQGDACALSPELGVFDGLLMANLLCRLPDPAACLKGLRNFTRSGSVMVFTTPCSWEERFTPREKWLEPMLEGMETHLGEWCDLLETDDIPFILRDHQRRAQYTVALLTVWRVR